MRQKKEAVCGWAVPADREGLRPLRSARTFGQDGVPRGMFLTD